MSHFAVSVFSKEGQTIEELLAPYQENNMGDCPKQYLEFNEVEEKYKKEFETESRKEFYCNSSSSWGQSVSSNVFEQLKNQSVGNTLHITIEKSIGFNYFKSNCNYKCYDNQTNTYPSEHIWIKVVNIVKTTHPDKNVCFDGIIEVELINSPTEIRLKDYYNNDFELFMQEWAGHEEKDSEMGKYGYWENPNKKWDWYQIGGRYSGLLTLKNEHASVYDNKVDSAKIKHIDFSLDKNEYNKNLRFWELIVDGESSKNKEEGDVVNRNHYKPEYFSNRYDNKEQYAQLTAEFGTYAVITPDGKWHSKGDMGWWGFSSESDDEAKQWNKSFKETFIDSIDPEWTLTIVDCHI